MNLPKVLNLAYKSRMKTKNWHRVVRAMAMVVVFCTTYALILPAITMESGTICGITAHSHTEQCYETVTVLHSHDDSCYTRTSVCGMEEHPAHQHLAQCTGFVPTLICENTEESHYHNAACYSYEQGLVCGLEESEGHAHNEACWQTDLICGLNENQEVSVTNLVCGMEEHVHEESCYPAPTESSTAETLPAVGDPNADVETESDWLLSFANLELTEDWSENLLAIANAQLGYAESKFNLSHDESGNIYGYTRYGAWYGQPYGHWDAKFISFCLHYAGVEGIPYGADTPQWLEVLTEEGLYLPKAEYQPSAGDLVFLDRDYDEKADHAAILYQIQPETGILELIAGDWNHRVDRVEVDEAAVLGYVPLPQEPSEEENSSEHYVSVSEDGITAEVQLNTALPEGAELTVTPIGEESEGYAAMAAQIEEALSENIEKLTLLDLSFTVDGEYHSVSDNATVTLCFDGDIFAGRQVKVFHFTENGPTELNSTATTFSTFSLRDEAVQTQLTFETEGFSVFAVVEVNNSPGYTFNKVNNIDINSLSGDYWIVSANNGQYAIEAVVDSANQGMRKSALNAGDHTVWTLTAVNGGYTITTTVNGTKFYLTMDTSGNMNLVQNPTQHHIFGAVKNAFDPSMVYLGNSPYYINHWGGSGGRFFKGYGGGLDNGSRLYLYKKTKTNEISVKNLDGESFALVNRYNRIAMTAESATEQATGKAALAAKSVNIIEKADGTYISNSTSDVPLWTFTAVDAANGIYHISTEVNGATKYLHLTTETRGDLTLSDTPQALTVTKWAGGNGICISNGVTSINSSTSDDNLDFWCHTDATPLMLCRLTDEASSFDVTYTHTDGNTYTVTFCLKNTLGNDIIVDQATIANLQKTFASGESITLNSDFAPQIDEFLFSHAVLEGTSPVVSMTTNDGGVFLFYEDNGGYFTRNTNVTVDLVYRSAYSVLNYELNLPTTNWYSSYYDYYTHVSNNWDITNPTLSGTTTQKIQANDGQTLHSINGRNVVGKFIANTFSSNLGGVRDYYQGLNTTQRNNNSLTADNYYCPGAEYLFLGWEAEVGGTTYLFPEGASVTVTESGDFLIDGVTIPSDTTLTGKWKLLSDVVVFYVNHHDTMLDLQDFQSISNYNPDYYTKIVAIGHLYNPYHIQVGEEDSGNGLIIKANDALIQAEISPYYDGTDRPQIVLDSLGSISGTNTVYTIEPNITQNRLEESVGKYLRDNPDDNTKIKLDNAHIDQSMINTDNYKLYWYLQKPVGGEGYHIDGVLVAKTHPMKIVKTFSGLEDGESEQILGINPDGTSLDNALDANGNPNYMNFPLHLVTTNEDGIDIKDYYTTLIAGMDNPGVFTNDKYNTNGDIYQWTLNSVKGQRYTFEEKKYNPLTDTSGRLKYDHSSLISVHYVNDPVPVFIYNTTKTYEDTTDATNSIKGYFEKRPLVGGTMDRVIFANFYTPRGTGMFSITKVSALNEQDKLKDAVFTLTMVKDSDGNDITNGTVLTQTTNENGAGHFSGLAAGTYLLEETTAPGGYQELSTKWYVEVDPDDSNDDMVTVKIWKTTADKSTAKNLYTTEGGLQEVFVIDNEPTSKTVTVNKYFRNISTSEIAQLKTSGYCIEVQKSDGTVVETLRLENAAGQPDGGHQWIIELDGEEGSGAIPYTFVEKGYLHPKYIDTVVNATIGGEDTEVTENSGQTEAKFTLIKNGHPKAVTISNSYINEFTLQIKKVDATDNNAPMKDVVFSVYTDQWNDSTGGESYDYTDYNGNVHTFWYKGETSPTNANGITEYTRLQISDNTTKEILYMIKEVKTPDGYMPLDEPIVEMVTIDTNNYEDGVYTLVVENQQRELAKVKVVATKNWELPKGLDPAPVTLMLYQKDADGTVTKLSEVTLDGTKKTSPVDSPVKYTVDGWVVTWEDLSYATNQYAYYYQYYVSETPMAGYNTSYGVIPTTHNNIEMAKALGYGSNDKALKRYVTITNSSGYELPSTGGFGVWWHYILGLGLMGAALWLHRLDVIKKRQGGMDSS